MGFETLSKSVKKENLRMEGEVKHFVTAPEVSTDNLTTIEKIIEPCDTAAQEELIGALNSMLNEIGVPETALEELEETQRSQVNILTRQYWEATKRLDLEAKRRYKKELAQLLG